MDLTWSAPAEQGCPTEAEVRGSIDRVVGAARDARRVRAVASVERVGEERFRVRLETRTGGVAGARVLEERSCRALGDAVAVILGWMVAPDAAPDGAPAPPIEPEPATEPLAAEPPRSALRPSFGVLASVDHGTLPETALGVTARLGLRAAKWFQVGAYATVLPERDYSTALVDSTMGTTTVGASLSLFAAGLEACFLFVPSPLLACAAAEVDHAWGRGFGVSEPASGSATWGAFTAAGGIALPLPGPLSLEIRAGPIVPFARERFGLDGVGEVNQPSSVGLRAGVGLSLAL